MQAYRWSGKVSHTMICEDFVEKLSGGDALIRTLRDIGVKHIWGYPGGAALPIYDAIYRQGGHSSSRSS